MPHQRDNGDRFNANVRVKFLILEIPLEDLQSDQFNKRYQCAQRLRHLSKQSPTYKFKDTNVPTAIYAERDIEYVPLDQALPEANFTIAWANPQVSTFGTDSMELQNRSEEF